MDLDRILREALDREKDTKKKGGLSADEALELEETLRKISAINLEKVVEEKRASLTPIDRMVEDLRENKNVTRALKVKRKETKKVHWSKRAARKRKYDRDYYKEVMRPRRKAELAEKLLTAEGWWERMNETWKLNGVKVEMTQEEFTEVIYPTMCSIPTSGTLAELRVTRVPVVIRYDKTLPIRLDNVLVRDTDTREVLYCGKEHKLRMLGYIL